MSPSKQLSRLAIRELQRYLHECICIIINNLNATGAKIHIDSPLTDAIKKWIEKYTDMISNYELCAKSRQMMLR
jgi:hypothetical protein